MARNTSPNFRSRALRNISEKTRVQVNSTQLGMFLRGNDLTNPILLFVHGEPGMPEYWLTRRYPIPLEKLFTVAWWEQRAAGLSYRTHIPPEDMTADRRSGFESPARPPERPSALLGCSWSAVQLRLAL